MADVAKTTGITGMSISGLTGDIKELGDGLRQMSTSMPVSIDGLARIAAVAGQLGVEGKKNIQDFTSIVAKSSIAFGIGEEATATYYAKIANAMGVGSDQITEYSTKTGSAVNKLGNTTAATEQEILDFLLAASPTAATFKESTAATAAFGATLISAGVDAGDAATSIRSALEYVQADKKGTRMETWAKLLGTDVQTLKKSLDSDLYGTLIKTGTALNGIASETDLNKTCMDIWGSYGFKVMGRMGNSLEAYQKNLRNANDAYDDGQSVLQEYDEKCKTLKAQLQLLKNGLNDVAITVGEAMAPALASAVQYINGSAIPAIKNLATALIAGDWKTAGDIIYQGLKTGIDKLSGLATKATDWFTKINWIELGGKAGDLIGQGLGGVTTLGTKVSDAIGAWINGPGPAQMGQLLGDGLKKGISLVTGWERGIHDRLTQWSTGGGAEELGKGIGGFIRDGIYRFWTEFSGGEKDPIKAIVNALNKVGDYIGIGINIAVGIGEGLLRDLEVALAPAYNALREWVIKAIVLTEGFGQDVKNGLTEATNALIMSLAGAASAMAAPFQTAKQSIDDAIDSLDEYLGKESFVTGKPVPTYQAFPDTPTPSITTPAHETFQGNTVTNQGSTKPISKYTTIGGNPVQFGYMAYDYIFGPKSSSLWYGGDADTKKAVGPILNALAGRITTAAIDKDFFSLPEVKGTNLYRNVAPILGFAGDWPADQNAWNWAKPYLNEPTKRQKYTMDTGEEVDWYPEQYRSYQYYQKGVPKATEGDFGKIIEESAKTSDEIEQDKKDNADQINKDSKETAQQNNELARDTAQATSATTVEAAKKTYTLSTAAANAIKIGGEISGNFLNHSGNAVAIAVDQATGQQVAVIGRVAQESYKSAIIAGGELVDSGTQAKNLSTLGASKISQSSTELSSTLDQGRIKTLEGAQGLADKSRVAADTQLSGTRQATSIVKSDFQIASDRIAAASTPWEKIMIGAEYAASALVNAGQQLLSMAGSYRIASLPSILQQYLGKNISKYATGGIVNKPTFALIGEAGPEAVIPLKDTLKFAEGGIITPIGGGSSGTFGGSLTIDFSGLTNAGMRVFNNFVDFMRNTWTIIKFDAINSWNQLKAQLQPIWTEMKNSAVFEFGGIRSTVLSGLQVMKDNSVLTFQGMRQDSLQVWTGMKDDATNELANLQTTVTNDIGMIKADLIKALAELSTTMAQKLPEFTNSFNAAVESWKSKVSEFIMALRSIDGVTVSPNVNFNYGAGGGAAGGYGMESAADFSGCIPWLPFPDELQYTPPSDPSKVDFRWQGSGTATATAKGGSADQGVAGGAPGKQMGFFDDPWMNTAKGTSTKGYPMLASGGIITRPTLAMIGEAGKEAVIPLDRFGNAGGFSSANIFLELDGRTLARMMGVRLMKEVRSTQPMKLV